MVKKSLVVSKALAFAVFVGMNTNVALADGHGDHSAKDNEVCQGFAGQTPRDIDSKSGTNPVNFELAPPASEMNLCNIHFHKDAEHKAKAFSIKSAEGYQCGISKNLTAAELSPTKKDICNGLKPGDTIEVHWVHTSCTTKPGPTLGACLSDACANPDLRVETQVFTLVNDENALDFSDFAYSGTMTNGYHQAKAIPADTGAPVEFMGSTTGPSYTEQACSPLQVSWSVRPQCAKLDINTIGAWCENNVFDENKAHGVRELVTDQRLLAPIE